MRRASISCWRAASSFFFASSFCFASSFARASPPGAGGGAPAPARAGRSRLRGRRRRPPRGHRRELDDPRAEQAVQALLDLLLGQRDHLEDLPRLQDPVDPGEDVPVGGAERHLLEAQQRVGGLVEHAVGVAERGPHDVRVLQQAHRLQDHLAGGQLQGRLAVEGDRGRLLELVFPVVPGEDGQEHLAHVEGEGVLEVLGVDQPHLLQGLAQPLPGGPLARPRALEVGRGQELVAHQHLAEVLVGDGALRAQDVALPEAHAAHVRPALEVEDTRLAPDVDRAQERRKRAFGEGALHVRRILGPRSKGGTAP